MGSTWAYSKKFSLSLSFFLMLMTPTPDDIKALRATYGLTQSECAKCVHVSLSAWQQWEAPPWQGNHRQMPAAAWELFTIKTAGLPGGPRFEKA